MGGDKEPWEVFDPAVAAGLSYMLGKTAEALAYPGSTPSRLGTAVSGSAAGTAESIQRYEELKRIERAIKKAQKRGGGIMGVLPNILGGVAGLVGGPVGFAAGIGALGTGAANMMGGGGAGDFSNAAMQMAQGLWQNGPMYQNLPTSPFNPMDDFGALGFY